MEEIKHTEELIKELDKKDRKILRELFSNARAPFSTIAKKVRLSKESVNYRIKRMMELGLVTGFNTIIDVKKIGWEMFLVYIRFRHIDVETEKQILETLKNHPNMAWLIKCIGNYDIIIKVFVKNPEEMDKIIKELESKYEINFDEYISDILIEERAVPFSFMYDPGKTKELFYLKTEKEQKIPPDNIDLKILKLLSNNARIPLSEIANKLKLSRDLIKYRLKRLEKNKVIINYRPDVWPKKLGYNWYFVILKLGELTHQLKSKLETFLLNHPNVTYFYKTIGSSDIQIEFRIKTRVKLNETLMELRSILKTVLKRHELQLILHEYKYTYFPNCLMKK